MLPAFVVPFGHTIVSDEPRISLKLPDFIKSVGVVLPNELVWVLGRMSRFPEMHHRIRVRGRMKAEQYRASRTFARLAGGRWDGPHARANGVVQVEGDTDLGDRVVDNMAFTL